MTDEAGGASTADAAGAPAPATGLSPVFLLLLAVAVGAFAWLASDAAAPIWLPFVAVSLGWIAAVCVHEYGHAAVAHAGGDEMVRERGYLTLNPLRYLHPVMSLGLPLLMAASGGIGFPGAAVYIRTEKLRSRAWMSLTSLAGPAATFVVLAIVALPFNLWPHTTFTPGFWSALALLAFLQATAALLNLLPVPGLDGFGVIAPWLPPSVQPAVARYRGTILMAFFVISLTQPKMLSGLWEIAEHLTDFFSINRRLISNGFDLYRFWRH